MVHGYEGILRKSSTVTRVGARYTWTNKQLNLIRCVLDRVFVSPAWAAVFPLSTLTAITQIGSDHDPLLLNCGEDTPTRQSRFFFQSWWFQVSGFGESLTGKLTDFLSNYGPHRGSIDLWQFVARHARTFLKGCGANLGRERREFKASLLAQLEDLDKIADQSGLDEEGWALRYHQEDQLVWMDKVEEECWRQRSRVQWTLKGDSGTAYFHAIANGRRRKCAIPRLITATGEVEEQQALMHHIYALYQGRMGSAGEPRAFGLAPALTEEDRRVSTGENLELELTFTADELEEVLLSMKPDSAHGPDGFPVLFFKRFRGILKALILQLLNDFVLGRVDVARLNFGIISLIPKVQGAESIKQFRPIALINVIFKFVAKSYAIRVAPLAHRTIDHSQSAFIKGRCLHEGELALHGIAHEFRVMKQKVLLLKLDFEKAYDRVNWDFLQEVLTCKGFSPMIVHQLMQLVDDPQV